MHAGEIFSKHKGRQAAFWICLTSEMSKAFIFQKNLFVPCVSGGLWLAKLPDPRVVSPHGVVVAVVVVTTPSDAHASVPPPHSCNSYSNDQNDDVDACPWILTHTYTHSHLNIQMLITLVVISLVLCFVNGGCLKMVRQMCSHTFTCNTHI